MERGTEVFIARMSGAPYAGMMLDAGDFGVSILEETSSCIAFVPWHNVATISTKHRVNPDELDLTPAEDVL